MWFNLSLDHQLAFDSVAAVYHETRLRFDRAAVARLADAAGVVPGDRVYEVGAGTGQLTESLLGYGFRVTANEPGDRMRAYLGSLPGGEALIVHDGRFEDDPVSPAAYAAVFAANSFHWIDPDVAFHKVAQMLRPGGSLCLVWNFSFTDPAVRARLNVSAFRDRDDLIHDTTLGPDAFGAVMTHGRGLIAASGYFETFRWGWHVKHRAMPAETFARFPQSYASTAALEPGDREALECAVLRDLDHLSCESVAIIDHIYSCVATMP